MSYGVPSDIQRIIQALVMHHMDVTGPTTSNGKWVYHVNGHLLSEEELRGLAQKQLLTSWDILNYARIRSARRTE